MSAAASGEPYSQPFLTAIRRDLSDAGNAQAARLKLLRLWYRFLPRPIALSPHRRSGMRLSAVDRSCRVYLSRRSGVADKSRASRASLLRSETGPHRYDAPSLTRISCWPRDWDPGSRFCQSIPAAFDEFAERWISGIAKAVTSSPSSPSSGSLAGHGSSQPRCYARGEPQRNRIA